MLELPNAQEGDSHAARSMQLFAQAVGHVLLDGLIAALGTAVGGLIALPTLASYSLHMEVAEVLMKIGHSLSGCAQRAQHVSGVIASL